MSNACVVSRLRLHRFRNYGETTVHLGPGLNVIAGRNAQGKTNLLEAVATLSLIRSPRAAAATDLLQWGASRCQVEATVVRGDISVELAARFEQREDSTRISHRTTIDGKPRHNRAVLGVCPVVLFWPEDLQLVKAGPEGRRRLLDTLLAQLDHRAAQHMSLYRRVLEQRNALLHRIRSEGRGRDELPGFTAELAHHGAYLTAARARLLDSLAPHASAALRELSGGGERLELTYLCRAGTASMDAGETEALLRAALQRRALEEETRGMTLVGPHRDDLEISIDERPARHAASQGQQRSIVLACKLAEMQHVRESSGVTPVVLLDDVLSELDRQRRAELLAALAAGAHQVLVTTTEPIAGAELFASARHFTVVAGTVSESAD